MTEDELRALPVSVDVPTAGKAYGISKLTSYRLAQAGEFPIPVIRVGRKYVVAKAALLASLGVDGKQKTETAAA